MSEKKVQAVRAVWGQHEFTVGTVHGAPVIMHNDRGVRGLEPPGSDPVPALADYGGR